ncbi:hypothetical protein CC78DRAFT_536819 [Lojkania enalia]|uniref:Uncharacterized protein n=1 Tax=Lojkania enalia TaxID=147567 RepID=A0A9P4N2H4_9PLEO|nr:hypothetical protein CC78DRAFT_536819 [Didymosphaeria enalia]
MASQTRAERQSVFSAYRKVFAGKNARVRKKKAIRNIVLRHWSSRKITAGDSKIGKVVPILKDAVRRARLRLGGEWQPMRTRST